MKRTDNDDQTVEKYCESFFIQGAKNLRTHALLEI